MIFEKTAVDLITPFTDTNEINFDKLTELVNFQIEKGIGAIICGSINGEFPTLTDDERLEIISHVLKVAKRRVPVIAATGSYDTRQTIQLSFKARKLGVDAILVITPYLNQCTNKGLINHYKMIATSVKVPIIIHNDKARTGIDIDVETLKELSKIKRVKGFLDYTKDINRLNSLVREFIAEKPEVLGDEELIIDDYGNVKIKQRKNINENDVYDFSIYTGNDDMIVSGSAMGISGVVSTLANIDPEAVVDIANSIDEGEMAMAKKRQLTCLPLINALNTEISPIPIKAALNMMGKDVGDLRLPLTTLTPDNAVILEKELAQKKYIVEIDESSVEY